MKKLKVVVADNNPVLLQQLAEAISRDNQTELAGIIDNGRDAYEIIEKEKPDVVVFDLLLSYYDGFALLDKIKQNKEYSEKLKLIMTTPIADDSIAKEAYRKGIDYIIIKPYNVETMVDKIKDIYKAMERKHSEELAHNMEAIISNKLNQIGVPASLKGYRYMITAVKEVLKDETVLEGVTKILYPGVAKIHNSTPQRVEKAIRHAIEVAWTRNGDSKLKEEFQYAMNAEKDRPTNSEFIAILSQNIKISA